MATLADQIADARNALHRLSTGTNTVSIRDSNGERIDYQPANASRLSAYIADLERQAAGRRPVLSINFATSKGL